MRIGAQVAENQRRQQKSLKEMENLNNELLLSDDAIIANEASELDYYIQKYPKEITVEYMKLSNDLHKHARSDPNQLKRVRKLLIAKSKNIDRLDYVKKMLILSMFMVMMLLKNNKKDMLLIALLIQLAGTKKYNELTVVVHVDMIDKKFVQYVIFFVYTSNLGPESLSRCNTFVHGSISSSDWNIV